MGIYNIFIMGCVLNYAYANVWFVSLSKLFRIFFFFKGIQERVFYNLGGITVHSLSSIRVLVSLLFSFFITPILFLKFCGCFAVSIRSAFWLLFVGKGKRKPCTHRILSFKVIP